MKRFLIAAAAVTLMCGVAPAQNMQGAGSGKSGAANMTTDKGNMGKTGKGVTTQRGTTGMSRQGTTGMSKGNSRAQPGGLAGSGSPDAGNQGGSAPGASAGGGG